MQELLAKEQQEEQVLRDITGVQVTQREKCAKRCPLSRADSGSAVAATGRCYLPGRCC